MLYLFSRCYQLETINLPNSLVSIGTEAFAWCNSLKDVTFPSGLEAIGDDAFDLGISNQEQPSHQRRIAFIFFGIFNVYL